MVDDVRRLLGDVFRAKGSNVVSFDDGEEGIRWLETNEPDLVVLLSAPVEVLAARRRGPADRIEREGDAFLAAVAASYAELAAAHGWAVVDAAADPDAVERAVWAVVERDLAP